MDVKVKCQACEKWFVYPRYEKRNKNLPVFCKACVEEFRLYVEKELAAGVPAQRRARILQLEKEMETHPPTLTLKPKQEKCKVVDPVSGVEFEMTMLPEKEYTTLLKKFGVKEGPDA
jgi:hypothetical protein